MRWGYAEGELVMGGRKVAVRKPRARKDGREVTLPSWAAFSDEDPLHERIVDQMTLGVSTRGYAFANERRYSRVPSFSDVLEGRPVLAHRLVQNGFVRALWGGSCMEAR